MTESKVIPQQQSDREKDSARAETMKDGRYIPFSGGILGWFENGGVPKSETGNNYQFHTMVDADSVRRKKFERWGSEPGINRRISTRKDVAREINLTITTPESTQSADTKDYATHGLRLQILDDELPMKKGEKVKVEIFSSAERTERLFELDSLVMWVNKTGRRRPVWNLGISFVELSFDEAEKLQMFFEGRESGPLPGR